MTLQEARVVPLCEDSRQNIVTPQPMSGFKEFQPDEQIVVNRCKDIIRRHFELASAAPLETSALERREILTAKEGGDSVDRQIYTVGRLAGSDDSDDTNYALRFDLTVPLARFVAQHHDRLTFPFRRYQIQSVWRGERPQAGRFRQFDQADIDFVGDGELGLMADAEIPTIVYGIFDEMKIGRFQIRISNRKLLEGFLTGAGIPRAHIADAMRIVDKLDKIGIDRVSAELQARLGLDNGQVGCVMDFVCLNGPAGYVLERLDTMKAGMNSNALIEQGLEEIGAVAGGVSMMGVPEGNFALDLSVARGLSYYTGTVYETTLLDHPGIGSICSGGRYDDLASLFTNRKLPGVGISIGLTRLVSRLLDAGILKAGPSTTAQVLVTSMDRDQINRYLVVAARLRRSGVGAEVYLEPQKIGQQLRYANRKGFRFALIAGETEFQSESWLLKDLVTGEQSSVPNDVVDVVIADAVVDSAKLSASDKQE